MAEKRESKRVCFHKPVKYGPVLPPKHRGYVEDLSSTGMYIHTNNVFKPGSLLYIAIEDSGKVYTVEGKVKSSKRVPATLARSVKCGMGIEFTEPNEKLSDIYQNKKNK